MSRMRITVVALLLALVTSPLVALAQQVVPGEPERLRDTVARLEPAAFVAIRLKDGSRLKGTVLGSDQQSFTITPHTRIPVPARSIAFEEVVAIERSHIGMSPGKKVLLGAAIGVGAVFVAVGALIASLD